MKIALQNVSKMFEGVKALDSISFEVNSGECFFLLGPSGCGKTTALRIIAGFCKPDAGTVHFDSRPVNDLAPHLRNTGMVFQNYALWPHLTVEENIAFGLTVPAHQAPKEERVKRIREIIALLHLEGTGKRMPGELSGGQQQRVALARALVVKPACLLFDEPLSNLDAKLRAEMRLEIRHIVKKLGITAVYVTHDQTEALIMADRCAIMRSGKIEQIGAPRGLYESPANGFVADFMGCSNLLRAKVLSIEQEGMKLSNAAGTWFSSCTPTGNISVGTDVIMAIRSEKIRLEHSCGGRPNSFSGSIREKIYLGMNFEYRIELSGGLTINSLSASGSADGREPGGDIFVGVDPLDVIVLPAE